MLGPGSRRDVRRAFGREPRTDAVAAPDDASPRAVSLNENELDWLLQGRPPPVTLEAIAARKARLERLRSAGSGRVTS